MSDDPTRDIDEKSATQPTIQTVLERLANLRALIETEFAAMSSRMNSLENRMDSLETRMDSLETRMDSLESRVSSLEVETRRVGEEIRRLSIQFDRVTSVAHDARAGVRELDDRVRVLENK